MPLVVRCDRKLVADAFRHARSLGKHSLTTLCQALRRPHGFDGRTELYGDFAPYSFGFASFLPNGKHRMSGGVLYHGPAGGPMAVSLNEDRGPRREIHT